MARYFGAFLVERGICSREQVEEATQAKIVFGGRLGTNLIELRYLKLEDLEKHLAEYLAVPVAPADWVDALGPEVIASVAADQVEKHRILPLRIEGRTLHLAMLDPRSPEALDEVAFATGLALKPYVMAEVRLSALLEHHYAIQRELRYINLGVEAAAGRAAGTAAKQPSPAPRADTVRQDEELIDEETFASLHSSWQTSAEDATGGPAAPPPQLRSEQVAPVGDLAVGAEALRGGDAAAAAIALEAQLWAARDREAVAAAALRVARLHSCAAALFVVRGGVVSGFRGDGDRIPEQIEGIMIPVEVESAAARAAASGAPFRGPAPEKGIDRTLVNALGRGAAREMSIFAIRIRQHVVNLLYADAGEHPLPETSLAALGALCELTSRAYERLILEQKRQLDSEA